MTYVDGEYFPGGDLACLGRGNVPPSPSGSSPVSLLDDDEDVDDCDDEEEEGRLFLNPSGTPSSSHQNSISSGYHHNSESNTAL